MKQLKKYSVIVVVVLLVLFVISCLYIDRKYNKRIYEKITQGEVLDLIDRTYNKDLLMVFELLGLGDVEENFKIKDFINVEFSPYKSGLFSSYAELSLKINEDKIKTKTNSKQVKNAPKDTQQRESTESKDLFKVKIHFSNIFFLTKRAVIDVFSQRLIDEFGMDWAFKNPHIGQIGLYYGIKDIKLAFNLEDINFIQENKLFRLKKPIYTLRLDHDLNIKGFSLHISEYADKDLKDMNLKGFDVAFQYDNPVSITTIIDTIIKNSAHKENVQAKLSLKELNYINDDKFIKLRGLKTKGQIGEQSGNFDIFCGSLLSNAIFRFSSPLDLKKIDTELDVDGVSRDFVRLLVDFNPFLVLLYLAQTQEPIHLVLKDGSMYIKNKRLFFDVDMNLKGLDFAIDMELFSKYNSPDILAPYAKDISEIGKESGINDLNEIIDRYFTKQNSKDDFYRFKLHYKENFLTGEGEYIINDNMDLESSTESNKSPATSDSKATK